MPIRVVLDETYLADPRRFSARSIPRRSERLDRRIHVSESHNDKIERRHHLHQTRSGQTPTRRSPSLLTGLVGVDGSQVGFAPTPTSRLLHACANGCPESAHLIAPDARGARELPALVPCFRLDAQLSKPLGGLQCAQGASHGHPAGRVFRRSRPLDPKARTREGQSRLRHRDACNDARRAARPDGFFCARRPESRHGRRRLVQRGWGKSGAVERRLLLFAGLCCQLEGIVANGAAVLLSVRITEWVSRCRSGCRSRIASCRPTGDGPHPRTCRSCLCRSRPRRGP